MVTQERLGFMEDNWIDVSDNVTVRSKFKVMVCECGQRHKVITGLLSKECDGCGEMIFDPKHEEREYDGEDTQAVLGWYNRDDDSQSGLEEWL